MTQGDRHEHQAQQRAVHEAVHYWNVDALRVVTLKVVLGREWEAGAAIEGERRRKPANGYVRKKAYLSPDRETCGGCLQAVAARLARHRNHFYEE